MLRVVWPAERSDEVSCNVSADAIAVKVTRVVVNGRK